MSKFFMIVAWWIPVVLASPIFAQTPPAASTKTSEQTSEKMEVKMTIATWQDISQTFDDSPLIVVDFWSLSCAPCLHEFPELVALKRKHGDAIRCVSVNVDYDGRRRRPPETYLDRATDFVASVDGAILENYLCQTPSDDVLAAIEAASIPTVLIYQDGQLVKKFVDAGQTAGFTYQDNVNPAVALLRQ